MPVFGPVPRGGRKKPHEPAQAFTRRFPTDIIAAGIPGFDFSGSAGCLTSIQDGEIMGNKDRGREKKKPKQPKTTPKPANPGRGQSR